MDIYALGLPSMVYCSSCGGSIFSQSIFPQNLNCLPRIFYPLKMDSCSKGKNRATQKQQRSCSIVFFFFFFYENKIRKITMKYKRNSPKLVMKITSVPQLLTCTKAPSPTTASFDSCHSRVIRNQQNLYPKFLLLS